MRSPMGAPELNNGQSASSTSSRSRAEVKYHRARADEFSDLSTSFQLPTANRDFQRQYFHLYSRRLEAMRPGLEKRVKDRGLDLVDLSELPNLEEGKEVVVVGTLFKNQSLKPSILKELAEDQGVPPQPVSGAVRYTSEVDELILEGSQQRIRLRCGEGQALQVGRLVTGVVAAFRGTVKESGKFFVEEVIFAPPPPQPERPIFQKDRYTAI